MDDGKRMMKIIFKAGGCLTSLFGGLIVVIALIVGIIALAVSGSSSAEISDPTNDVYVLGLQQVQSEQHIANTINISVIKKACLVSGNNMTDKDTVATFIKKYFVKEAKATVPTQAQTTVPATTTKTYQFVTDEELKEIFKKTPFSLSSEKIEQIFNSKSQYNEDLSDYGGKFSPFIGTGKLGWPFVNDYYISCEFGGYAGHSGIDLSCAGADGKPVYAAADGVVTSATVSNVSYGNCVLIEHGGMQTRYAHLKRIITHQGASVKKGELIGLCGSTGNSTGPHLHFEVIINGEKVNPSFYLFG